MDPNQSRIIELLREVHLIAVKEIERLNLRILELENSNRPPVEKGVVTKPAGTQPPTVDPAPANKPSLPKQAEILNEHQVAEHVNMSVATVRRWRLFRQGPKFMKIGSAVRYRRADLEAWLGSLSGLE